MTGVMDDAAPIIALPPAAGPAVEVARRLADAGYTALLAGGCVRDLLLGTTPSDYDVATDAPPDAVCSLFRPTRRVGVQFGVVLVRQRGGWIEVATFRKDGDYRDGRRPDTVTFSSPAEDARRRDFTVNGMFLDPQSGRVIDYVNGLADLAAGLIRAIGDPAARFAEDHLRLIRAVRFAARLGFRIEPGTAEAIRAVAHLLRRVASERVREELERILSAASRSAAVELMDELNLLPHLWEGDALPPDQVEAAARRLKRLPADAGFELAFATLTASIAPARLDALCRRLTCANDAREDIVWLVAHQADLDAPSQPSLAALKRILSHRRGADLLALARVRHAETADGDERCAALAARVAAIDPSRIAPPPLVTGEDLAARGVPAGPLYGQILAALYTQQLDETLNSRGAALAALDARLRALALP